MPINKLSRLFLILLVCGLSLLINHAAHSQTGAAAAARKFDEFGDIQISDLIARLDNFAIELENNPSVRGFVMAYRSHRDLPGLSSRLSFRMKEYLVNSRGLAAERVVTVDGGEASCLAQELWVVPPGTAPAPRADAYPRAFVDTESTRKFDEYLIDNEYTSGIAGSLDAFAAALRKEPRAQAYIIAYPQYYVESWYQLDTVTNKSKSGRRVQLDSPGTAMLMLRAVKARLVSDHRIAANRIKFMNGGYRKQSSIELWIVPRGEHPPVPTPNSFPKRRRARR